MADKTGIEWTDATWNPIRGCSRVSDGCRHCYAEGQAARIIAMDRGRGVRLGLGAYDGLLNEHGRWNGLIKVVESAMDQPLRWRKPRRVFVNSMSDLFHENVPDEVIDQVFAVMLLAKQHTFQVLTKRPERMRDYVRAGGGACIRVGIRHAVERMGYPDPGAIGKALPNVWLGVSVEDQAAADERIPLLLDTPAAVRWLSCEPLLGPVDLLPAYLPCPNAEDARQDPSTGVWECCSACDYSGYGDEIGIDWVVVGGESGPGARPMDEQWALDLRDQCQAAGVPFLFKQWGEWLPGKQLDANGYHVLDKGTLQASRVGKKRAGRLLDGQLYDGYPEGHG